MITAIIKTEQYFTFYREHISLKQHLDYRTSGTLSSMILSSSAFFFGTTLVYIHKLKVLSHLSL